MLLLGDQTLSLMVVELALRASFLMWEDMYAQPAMTPRVKPIAKVPP